MVVLGKAQIADTETTIPLLEADPQLRWEPSIAYIVDQARLEWKIALAWRAISRSAGCWARSTATDQIPGKSTGWTFTGWAATATGT